MFSFCNIKMKDFVWSWSLFTDVFYNGMLSHCTMSLMGNSGGSVSTIFIQYVSHHHLMSVLLSFRPFCWKNKDSNRTEDSGITARKHPAFIS